jgi:hypothetical protein
MKQKNMTLRQLIKIADAGYGDSRVLQAFKEQSYKRPDPLAVGDGLAWFIAQELKETFDPKASKSAQLKEAIRVMNMARQEVGSVELEFEKEIITNG